MREIVKQSQSETRQDSTQIEDANLVAFLVMKGYTAIPYIKVEQTDSNSSRVAWDVQGDERAIDAEIKMFQSNERVGIRDYVRVLKDVRGQMYFCKSLTGNLRKGG